MSVPDMTRRDWLLAGGTLSAAAAFGEIAGHVKNRPTPRAPRGASNREPFGYCLNTSTIRGQKLELPAQIDVAAAAGYPRSSCGSATCKVSRKGGSLRDLANRHSRPGPGRSQHDRVLLVDVRRRDARARDSSRPSARWTSCGKSARRGSPHRPPASDHRVDLLDAAHRYRELLGHRLVPGRGARLELWGFSKSLSRVGEVACVVMESGHPQACLLLDVFHIYKGGSDFGSLRFLNGSAMHVLHMNDYPAVPPRHESTMPRGFFPATGSRRWARFSARSAISAIAVICRWNSSIRSTGNRTPHLMARTGLQKMKHAVQTALLRCDSKRVFSVQSAGPAIDRISTTLTRFKTPADSPTYFQLNTRFLDVGRWPY